MAYTNHGNHIPGTNRGEGITKAHLIPLCKGVDACKECMQDVETYHLRFMGEPTDYPARAKRLVDEHVSRRLRGFLMGNADIPAYEVYVESFTFVLGGYKAMVCTTLDDKMSYQVTYNGEKRETYLDEYRKLANIVIPD